MSDELEHVVFLDARGSEKFRNLLWEKVYQGRTYVPSRGADPIPMDRDMLDNYDTFELFKSLAKQSKFPIPKSSGNADPITYLYPNKLPKDFDRKSFGFPVYMEALDMLFNGENREVGYSRRGQYGQHTGGNTSVNTIDTALFTNVLDWMGANLPAEEALKLPKPYDAQDQKKSAKAVERVRYYRKNSEQLKKAFCDGLGLDVELVKNLDFSSLFNNIIYYTNPQIIRYADQNQFFITKGKTFSKNLLELFNPDVKYGPRETGAGSQFISRCMNSVLSGGAHWTNSLSNLIDETLAFKIGYTIRHFGAIEEYAKQKRWVLLPHGEIPAHMLNQDAPEKLRSLELPPEEYAETPGESVEKRYGSVSALYTRVMPDNERINQSGHQYSVELKKDDKTKCVSVTLPPNIEIDEILTSVDSRISRFNPDAVGLNVVEAAINEAIRQRTV